MIRYNRPYIKIQQTNIQLVRIHPHTINFNRTTYECYNSCSFVNEPILCLSLNKTRTVMEIYVSDKNTYDWVQHTNIQLVRIHTHTIELDRVIHEYVQNFAFLNEPNPCLSPNKTIMSMEIYVSVRINIIRYNRPYDKAQQPNIQFAKIHPQRIKCNRIHTNTYNNCAFLNEPNPCLQSNKTRMFMEIYVFDRIHMIR